MSNVLITNVGSTNIGDMTSGAGLAAAFDGNFNQASSVGTLALTGTGYVGKAYPIDHIPTQCIAYHCPVDVRNAGFGNTGGTITFTVYGKISLPANGTDGTVLGTTTSPDATVLDITIPCSGSTPYDYVWLYMSDSVGGGSVYLAEVEFFEAGITTYTLEAAAGQYLLIGVTATLKNALLLAAAAAAYVLTGNGAVMGQGFVLVAAAGSYVLTGVRAAVARIVASASKFKRRVSGFVLQKLRANAPTLGD